MTVNQQIIDLLDKNGIAYEALQHEPTKTCADSAQIRGTSPDQGAKALVCFADKKPVMVVLPCSCKLDSRLFKQVFGAKDLRLASADEVRQLTGLEIGSIPPWGSLFSLPTFMDEALAGQARIAFNAGDLCRSIIMPCADYVQLEKPRRGSFSILASSSDLTPR